MLIEFAFSVWTLFLVTFLIFEFCMMVYTYSVLGNAAREGVRYAVVHGTDNSVLQRSQRADAATPRAATSPRWSMAMLRVSFHDISGMTVTPSWPDGSVNAGQPGAGYRSPIPMLRT